MLGLGGRWSYCDEQHGYSGTVYVNINVWLVHLWRWADLLDIYCMVHGMFC